MPEFQRGPIQFEGDGSIDINKNRQGRETENVSELRTKIHSEVADYVRAVKDAKHSKDLELPENNMINYVGISYWDGADEEKKKNILAIIKDIPGLNTEQTKFVFRVAAGLLKRSHRHTPKFGEIIDLEDAA
jgi:hypothetical protein